MVKGNGRLSDIFYTNPDAAIFLLTLQFASRLPADPMNLFEKSLEIPSFSKDKEKLEPRRIPINYRTRHNL